MSDTSLPQLDWRVVFNRASPPDGRNWGRVRAAQIASMANAITIASIGQALNAILLVLILKDDVPGWTLAAWVLGLVCVMLMTIRYRKMARGREIHSVPRRAIDRAAFHGICFGLVWAIPAAIFFGQATEPQQLAIGIITASMMAGAAFIFATVPPAAFAYILVMGTASSSMLTATESPYIIAIAPIYTIGLFLMVLANGRTFMQRKCVELALEERTDTVSLLLREYETSDADWLWQTNRKLEFQNVSVRFARAIGREVHEIEGRSLVELLRQGQEASPLDGCNVDSLIEMIERESAFTEISAPIGGSGATKCIELSARPSYNRQGRFVGYQGVGSDVTEARQAADRISHMARHDMLTGLPNRLQLHDALAIALRRAAETGKTCAILLIDLDRFKSVNDSLGHVAGDRLLQQVSQRIAPLLAPGMTAGRLGGDEFAIVLPQADEPSALKQLCFRLVEALKQPFVYEDQHLFVGASIGVAIAPADGVSVEELIRNADLALYRAKDGGGNDVRFYEPGFHARAEERRRMELALRTALDDQEFSLVYQPVVDSADARIRSFEALLRWNSRELGPVPPASFVPLAEETGLLSRIGEWVLRSACAEAANWPSDVAVAVNVSPRQLQEPGFILTLVSALSQAQLDPCRLELELTETVFLNVTQATQKILQQIRSLGVRLAMDDFGTGYSSLGYLRKANFDTLKIDKSFIQSDDAIDAEGAAIIKAVVALADSLGMKTVAEGVETEAQLAMVRELGCDRIQGYIFSMPVSSAEARSLLSRERGRAAA